MLAKENSPHRVTWYRPSSWGVTWFRPKSVHAAGRAVEDGVTWCEGTTDRTADRRHEGVTWYRPSTSGAAWNRPATGVTEMRGNTFGVTWMRSPTLGVTWLTGAALCLLALVASITVASAPVPDHETASVGTLQPSMIEFLASADHDGAVSLKDVRKVALRRVRGVGTGAGIDVALIDTGVAPVYGLTGDGKVLYGPDLSFEGAYPETAYLDTYGHGTHMAGIIAGNRPRERGVAPKARIVSVKVAGHDGVTTVPQVIAAIDWVVEHRTTDGLNIRILNLSLGQQGVSEHVGDALSAAVERAWTAGIFVVVAGGNDGDIQAHLDSPAIDPYVFAVGAVNTLSSSRKRLWDVPDWSAQGDGERNPDVVAPGLSVASYRVPGSTIDLAVPSARQGEDLFRGSGTSQAAAAVSGAAAAILSSNPTLTNDDLKHVLLTSADDLRGEEATKDGKGLIDAAGATRQAIPGNPQVFQSAAGPGTGLASPATSTWSGGTWSRATWSGATWSGLTWSGASWSGAQWSGTIWSGATWSGATWSGNLWTGATWSGATWSGATWSGATWSGNGWNTDPNAALNAALTAAAGAVDAVDDQADMIEEELFEDDLLDDQDHSKDVPDEGELDYKDGAAEAIADDAAETTATPAQAGETIVAGTPAPDTAVAAVVPPAAPAPDEDGAYTETARNVEALTPLSK